MDTSQVPKPMIPIRLMAHRILGFGLGATWIIVLEKVATHGRLGFLSELLPIIELIVVLLVVSKKFFARFPPTFTQWFLVGTLVLILLPLLSPLFGFIALMTGGHLTY